MPKVCFNGNDGNYLPHKRKQMLKYCNSIGLVVIGRALIHKAHGSVALVSDGQKLYIKRAIEVIKDSALVGL